MRTAIDTNVLSALWSKEQFAFDVARDLGNAKTEGGVVIGAPVYAELLAHPKATEKFVDNFLSDTGIVVDFDPETIGMVGGRSPLCTLRKTAATVVTGRAETFARRFHHWGARPDAG